MDLESQLCDTYQEEKQQRYLQLIGHTDDYLYVPFTEWTSHMFQQVKEQGLQKEEWNCPSYNEVSMNYITSEYVKDSDKPHFIPFGTTCAICLDPLTSCKNSYITECNHHFHKTCLTMYYNTTFINRHFNCPLCRHHLKKCLWLESRYALEPWRLPSRKHISVNADYEFQQELLNKDIILCRGCACKPGCFKIVGTNPSCEACRAWKHFSLEDLQHTCTFDDENEENTDESMRYCCLWDGVVNCITGAISFLYTYRRSLITPLE